MADAKLTEILASLKTAMLAVTNVENVNTYLMSMGRKEKDFKEKFLETAKTRVQGWLCWREGVEGSETRDIDSIPHVHQIHIIGFHTWLANDSAPEIRFQDICTSIYHKLATKNDFPDAHFIEQDPSIQGPEVAEVGTYKTAVLYVEMSFYPCVLVPI